MIRPLQQEEVCGDICRGDREVVCVGVVGHGLENWFIVILPAARELLSAPLRLRGAGAAVVLRSLSPWATSSPLQCCRELGTCAPSLVVKCYENLYSFHETGKPQEPGWACVGPLAANLLSSGTSKIFFGVLV